MIPQWTQCLCGYIADPQKEIKPQSMKTSSFQADPP
jgi:hypothetical protein